MDNLNKETEAADKAKLQAITQLQQKEEKERIEKEEQERKRIEQQRQEQLRLEQQRLEQQRQEQQRLEQQRLEEQQRQAAAARAAAQTTAPTAQPTQNPPSTTAPATSTPAPINVPTTFPPGSLEAQLVQGKYIVEEALRNHLVSKQLHQQLTAFYDAIPPNEKSQVSRLITNDFNALSGRMSQIMAKVKLDRYFWTHVN